MWHRPRPRHRVPRSAGSTVGTDTGGGGGAGGELLPQWLAPFRARIPGRGQGGKTRGEHSPGENPCSWTHRQAWRESKKVGMGCGWRFAFQNQVRLSHRMQSPRARQCPKNSPTQPRLALSWVTRPKSEMDPSLGSPLEMEPGACLLSVCCALKLSEGGWTASYAGTKLKCTRTAWRRPPACLAVWCDSEGGDSRAQQ